MLPHRPRVCDGDAVRDFSQNAGLGEAERSDRLEHHCQICPTCSHQLTGHRCKLVCTYCGYYLSCADYY